MYFTHFLWRAYCVSHTTEGVGVQQRPERATASALSGCQL